MNSLMVVLHTMAGRRPSLGEPRRRMHCSAACTLPSSAIISCIEAVASAPEAAPVIVWRPEGVLRHRPARWEDYEISDSGACGGCVGTCGWLGCATAACCAGWLALWLPRPHSHVCLLPAPTHAAGPPLGRRHAAPTRDGRGGREHREDGGVGVVKAHRVNCRWVGGWVGWRGWGCVGVWVCVWGGGGGGGSGNGCSAAGGQLPLLCVTLLPDLGATATGAAGRLQGWETTGQSHSCQQCHSLSPLHLPGQNLFRSYL